MSVSTWSAHHVELRCMPANAEARICVSGCTAIQRCVHGGFIGISPRVVKVLAIGLLLTTPGAIGQTPARHSLPISDFKITLLGTSTPNPLPDRFGPSTLVEAGPERLGFDCGRGCPTPL